jgi:hypothetical protein
MGQNFSAVCSLVCFHIQSVGRFFAHALKKGLVLNVISGLDSVRIIL